MNASVREQIRWRANYRCEYCRLPEAVIPATFHVEHVRAVQHGGSDDLDNLALACDRCNLFKGTNLSAIDPESGNIVLLFHPRTQEWLKHFSQKGFTIAGMSETGRATANLLNMNARRRLQLRTLLKINLLA